MIPGSLDSARIPDGDMGFIGVDMRVDPQQLESGYCSFAKNARFRFGRAETRLGRFPLRYSLTGAFNWPIEWDKGDIRWNAPVSIGVIYGIGIWDDPNGVQWQLFVSATDGVGSQVRVWAARQGNNIRLVPLAGAVTLVDDQHFPTDSKTALDRFWFTSAFDKCFLHTGFDSAVYVMDSINEGFKVAEATSSSNPEVFSIPNSETSIYFQNRLSVPYRPGTAKRADSMAASDVLSPTDYSVFNSFRINQGDSDEIVLAKKFNDNTAIVFKESSIYAVTNLIGDWSQTAVLDEVTSEYGLVGRRSVAVVGKDLWFLSQRGVTSIQRTEDNKLQGTDQPISTPMQPIVERINWFAAKTTACAAYFSDRYYLSVPIDGSYTNNCVLVYDALNRAWSGYDDVAVKYFYIADQSGSDALFYTDYAGGIGLYEYGEEDIVSSGAPDTHTVDIVLVGPPPDGMTLQVNGGDLIRATSDLDWIDDNDSEVITDDGEVTVMSLDKNWDQGATKHWGTGNPFPGVCNTFASDNLFLGFSTSDADYTQWDSGGTSATQITCGVRLTDTDPIVVKTSDPYLRVISNSETSHEVVPIEFVIITRGYGYAGGSQGRWRNGMVHVSTWDPSYTITVMTDGAFEDSAWVDAGGNVSYVTKDRTKYLGFAIDDWTIDNPNKDFATPGREDYSVVLETSEPSGGTFLQVDGTQLSQYQTWTNKFMTNRRGAFYQIKLENNQGRIRVHAAGAVKVRGESKHGEHGALS